MFVVVSSSMMTTSVAVEGVGASIVGPVSAVVDGRELGVWAGVLGVDVVAVEAGGSDVAPVVLGLAVGASIAIALASW